MILLNIAHPLIRDWCVRDVSATKLLPAFSHRRR